MSEAPKLTPDALRRLLEEATPDQLSAILLALSAERPEIAGPLLDRLKAMKKDG